VAAWGGRLAGAIVLTGLVTALALQILGLRVRLLDVLHGHHRWAVFCGPALRQHFVDQRAPKRDLPAVEGTGVVPELTIFGARSDQSVAEAVRRAGGADAEAGAIVLQNAIG
jgi:hypothetical protein